MPSSFISFIDETATKRRETQHSNHFGLSCTGRCFPKRIERCYVAGTRASVGASVFRALCSGPLRACAAVPTRWSDVPPQPSATPETHVPLVLLSKSLLVLWKLFRMRAWHLRRSRLQVTCCNQLCWLKFYSVYQSYRRYAGRRFSAHPSTSLHDGPTDRRTPECQASAPRTRDSRRTCSTSCALRAPCQSSSLAHSKTCPICSCTTFSRRCENMEDTHSSAPSWRSGSRAVAREHANPGSWNELRVRSLNDAVTSCSRTQSCRAQRQGSQLPRRARHQTEAPLRTTTRRRSVRRRTRRARRCGITIALSAPSSGPGALNPLLGLDSNSLISATRRKLA
ncbi:hypothetical protein B0H15DRAFT_429512 [Mycena belliarum]|uniref:Uncharacterized protein n=1 Tax=Mycena belliarum TaxID=1033014 RepID=A0AAD6XRV3_9AGAR|nr:hypothetical protein B0H15DRAFT_429512 [Mycena belliae]